MFKQAMVDEWTAAVVEEILKRLADQRKPFKYVGESEKRLSIALPYPCPKITQGALGFR